MPPPHHHHRPSTTFAYPPPLWIHIHIPPPIHIHIPPPICIHIPPPLPYTTTAAIYHNHISTTNPSSSHIRFVLEINLNSDSCFLACVGLRKKEFGDPRAVFRPKFWRPKIFFPYPIFRLFWVFWATCHHSDFLSHFFVVVTLIFEKNVKKKSRAHPVSLTWEEFWDTRHYSDFFRTKKKKKEERKKKKSAKKIAIFFPECAFPLFTCSAVILLVF